MSSFEGIRRAVLSQAVGNVGPGVTEMFRNVQVRNYPLNATWDGHLPQGLYELLNVQECSTSEPFGKTNPNPDLTPRQVSAARLIVAGHSGRSTARHLGVEEHAVSRWRKLPAFRAELDRQHRLFLAALAPAHGGRRG